MHLCNYDYSQGVEHFHHHSSLFLLLVNPYPHRQSPFRFLSSQIVLKLHINGVIQYIFILSFPLHTVAFICLCCCLYHYSFLFIAKGVHCVNIHNFIVYSYIDGFGLFQVYGQYDKSCCEHLCAIFVQASIFISFGCISRNEIVGLQDTCIIELYKIFAHSFPFELDHTHQECIRVSVAPHTF